MIKSYSELIKLSTFEERYKYLKLNGKPADITFGSFRYLNQSFYSSPIWKKIRKEVILRDNACDLGIEERPIFKYIYIHHINPITMEDIIKQNGLIYNIENLICVSRETHNAIHYGDESQLFLQITERKPGDTSLW